MKPRFSGFHGYGSGSETLIFWVLGLGIRPIPKTQTQFYIGVNVWLILMLILDLIDIRKYNYPSLVLYLPKC